MALQRGTPIDPRLQMLDVSPALQAGALELQSMVNLNESIQGAVQNFQEKQEEKKQKQITMNALRDLIPGMSDDVYKAATNDKNVRDSLFDAKKIKEQADSDRLTKLGYLASQIEDPEERMKYLESQGIVIPFDVLDFEIGLSTERQQVLDFIKQNPNEEGNRKRLFALGVPSREVDNLLEGYKSSVKTPTKDSETVEPKMTAEEEKQFIEEASPVGAIKSAVGSTVETAKDVASDRGPSSSQFIMDFVNPNFLRSQFGPPKQ